MPRATDPRGYVYVLCFDRPFSHARHYIGCTTDPRGRMRCHARGRGATIVRRAAEQGIGFSVGAVGSCSLAVLRRLERHAKDWKNAERFCERCNELATAIPGTRPYPLALLPFPRNSKALAATSEEPVLEIGFTTHDWLNADTLADVYAQAKELMQEEKHALGWIPVAGLANMILRGKVIAALADGSLLAGYVAFSEVERDHVTINQCVVRDAFRGCGIGRRMIELLKRNRPGTPFRASVREDLAANGFWTAIGFSLESWNHHETSGARLNAYTHSNEVF